MLYIYTITTRSRRIPWYINSETRDCLASCDDVKHLSPDLMLDSSLPRHALSINRQHRNLEVTPGDTDLCTAHNITCDRAQLTAHEAPPHEAAFDHVCQSASSNLPYISTPIRHTTSARATHHPLLNQPRDQTNALRLPRFSSCMSERPAWT